MLQCFLWLVAAQQKVTSVLPKKMLQCNFCSPKIAAQLLFLFVACCKGGGGGLDLRWIKLSWCNTTLFPFSTFFPKKPGLTPKTVIFQYFFVHFLALEGLHSCVSDFLPLFTHYTCAFLLTGKGANREVPETHEEMPGAHGWGQNHTENLVPRRDLPESYETPPRHPLNYTWTPPNHTGTPPNHTGIPESYGDPPESYGDPGRG